MKELFKKLKNLTGYNMADVANEFNVSRQHIHQSSRNYSMTYVNSNKYMINQMIDKKIIELLGKIKELNDFKIEIKEHKEKDLSSGN